MNKPSPADTVLSLLAQALERVSGRTRANGAAGGRHS